MDSRSGRRGGTFVETGPTINLAVSKLRLSFLSRGAASRRTLISICDPSLLEYSEYGICSCDDNLCEVKFYRSRVVGRCQPVRRLRSVGLAPSWM